MSSSGDLHLSSPLVDAIAGLLEQFCADTGSLAACLLDECGNQLVQGGAVEIRDHGETAALAAGAFAATRQLAARLGETEFDGLMHHGCQRHFYLSPVTRDFLLLSVFGQSVPAGIVRLCAARLAPRLREALLAVDHVPPPGAFAAVAEERTGSGVIPAPPPPRTEALPVGPCDVPPPFQPEPDADPHESLAGPFPHRNIIPMPAPSARLAER